MGSSISGNVTSTFSTIAVSGQSDIVADSGADTLTMVGSGVTLTTNASTDTLTITGSSTTIGATQVAYATATDTLGGEAAFTYLAASDTLQAGILAPLTSLTFAAASGYANQILEGSQSTSGGGGQRSLIIRAASSTADYGGNLTLQSGTGGGAGAQGGGISIQAGNGTDDRGGNVTITSGNGSAGGSAGAITIAGQDSFVGNSDGGSVTIQAGAKHGSGADGTLALIAQGAGTLTLTSPGGIALNNDVTAATGTALKTDTTTAHTFLLQAYDVNGTTYRTFLTFTNGDVPDCTISAPSGGTMTLQPSTYKSADGSSGVSAGPFTAITGITVKNGLVTALTGT